MKYYKGSEESGVWPNMIIFDLNRKDLINAIISTKNGVILLLFKMLPD